MFSSKISHKLYISCVAFVLQIMVAAYFLNNAATKHIDFATQELAESGGNDLALAEDITRARRSLHVEQLGSAVGLFLSLAYFYFIIRSIQRPLVELDHAMEAIAKGNSKVSVPHTHRADEIGAMAKSVEFFKKKVAEADEMSAKQKAETAAKEARQQHVDAEIGRFRSASTQAINVFSSMAGQLDLASRSMARSAAGANGKVAEVVHLSVGASSNVQTVAAAAEELSSSIREIASRVFSSTQVVEEAMVAVGQGEHSAEDLKNAASKIGSVIEIINGLASQINLLALNATIESARAGEAGRGFAVVASEVKHLATQTASATSQITQQIESVQAIATQVVQIVSSIRDTVNKVKEFSSTISAAVEEQSAVTNEIANTMNRASSGVGEITSNIEVVRTATSQVSSASQEVTQAANMLTCQAESLSSEIKAFLGNLQSA